METKFSKSVNNLKNWIDYLVVYASVCLVMCCFKPDISIFAFIGVAIALNIIMRKLEDNKE